MIKHAPIGFLCILGAQCMISSVFFFLRDFKTQTIIVFCVFVYYLITTFISFAVTVISIPNNAYFIQYHFKITQFIYNSNIAGCFINKDEK